MKEIYLDGTEQDNSRWPSQQCVANIPLRIGGMQRLE